MKKELLELLEASNALLSTIDSELLNHSQLRCSLAVDRLLDHGQVFKDEWGVGYCESNQKTYAHYGDDSDDPGCIDLPSLQEGYVYQQFSCDDEKIDPFWEDKEGKLYEFACYRPDETSENNLELEVDRQFDVNEYADRVTQITLERNLF